MRKPSSLLLLVCTVALLVTTGMLAAADVAVCQGNVQVTVSAPDNVAPGESFTANVNIGQVTGFDAASYDVSFTSTVLRLDGVSPGLIGSTAIPVDFSNPVGSGVYRIVQNVPGLAGVTGSGYLAVLRFTAIGAGTTNITLTNGTLSHISQPLAIPSTWSGDTVTVVSVASAATPVTPLPATPAPGATRVSESVRSDGVFTAAVTARSEDAKCLLSIPSGTKGLTVAGQALTEITMVQQSSPPSAPPDSRAVGSVYDLGPDGATFNPPLSLTFTYSKAELPAGVAEENLVVASCDRTSGEWSKLPSTVATQTSTITAQVSHFTSFAVLAYTRRAAFTASQLNVVPAVVDSGATVTISALITNTGDLSGSYRITLKVDGSPAGTQEVTLRGGASQQVTFTTSQRTAGRHTVAVDSLSGTFEVRAAPAAFLVRNLSISPGAAEPGQPVSISVEVVNTGGARGTHRLALQIDGTAADTREVGVNPGEIERVTFSVTRDVPKSYVVSLGGLSGAFQVAAAAPGQSAAPAGAPPPASGAPAGASPADAPPTPPPPPSDMPLSPAVLGGVAGAILLVWLVVRLARRGGGY